MSTTAINKRAEIDCFALHGSACTILTDRYPTVEDCMQCHFRKPKREVTNGISYPIRTTADDGNK